MTRSRILVTLAALVVVLLAGVAWAIGLFSPAPEEATVDDLAAAVGDDGGAEIETLDGSWTVTTIEGTFVGYRIDEILGGVDFTAVGRTSAVTGSLVGEGTTITEVDVEADLTGLESDSSARDGQLRRQALETETFPTATFRLTQPIVLDAIPEPGSEVNVEAVGELTIHGVTREATIPLAASQQSGLILAVGQVEVALADHDIATPSAPRVAGVSETAVMEFSLAFEQT